jgi:hypothetical protein
MAQTASIANIPFDFKVTGMTMPAGHYSVELDAGRNLLTFRNATSGRTAKLLAHTNASGMKEQPVLIFRRNGESYRLESAWFAGIQGGYGPLPAKRDRSDGERDMVATVRLLQK